MLFGKAKHNWPDYIIKDYKFYLEKSAKKDPKNYGKFFADYDKKFLHKHYNYKNYYQLKKDQENEY
jgi:hypothetical protein